MMTLQLLSCRACCPHGKLRQREATTLLVSVHFVVHASVKYCSYLVTAVLQGLLSKWHAESASGNKVLIFSRSTRCLDLLEVGLMSTLEAIVERFAMVAGWSDLDSTIVLQTLIARLSN
jgi:hypothetical protein